MLTFKNLFTVTAFYILVDLMFVNMQENSLASDGILAHFFNEFLSLPVK